MKRCCIFPGSLCEGGEEQDSKGADNFGAAPSAEYAMRGKDILKMEVERMRQLSEEAKVLQVSWKRKMLGHPIEASDGATWEQHFHKDGKPYFYCLNT